MSTISPPANIGFGTVVGQFVLDIVDSADAGADPDFVTASGSITFTPSVAKLLDATATPNPVTVVRSKITGVLDSSGYLCTPNSDGSPGARGLKLIATDDTDLNPVNWTWGVTYNLLDASGKQLTAPAPHSMLLPQGTTVDLTNVAPVDSSTGDAIVVGPRGSKWYVGHGTPAVWLAANPTVFDDALPDDQYLDLDTGNIYTLS